MQKEALAVIFKLSWAWPGPSGVELASHKWHKSASQLKSPMWWVKLVDVKPMLPVRHRGRKYNGVTLHEP